MVGAQNAIKMASSFFPLRKSTSATMMMDTTTRSIIQFITPTRLTKFLNMYKRTRDILLTQGIDKNEENVKNIVFFLTFFLDSLLAKYPRDGGIF